MSAGIKQMLAERARIEADEAAARKLAQKWDRLSDRVIAMIDKAAPFMDEESGPTKWTPSARLKIFYFVAATSQSEGAEKRALLFILEMLDEARKLWVEGFVPDPWADQPRLRS